MTYTIEKVPLSVKQQIIHLLNQVVKLPLPFRGDGREVRNEGFVFGYYRPPLSPPKVGRTGLSAS